jgi:hypothetical protein
VIESIFFYAFFLATLASGLWCFIAPRQAFSLRRRLGWSESVSSGGFLYANERRTRVSGGVVAIVSLTVLLVNFAN